MKAACYRSSGSDVQTYTHIEKGKERKRKNRKEKKRKRKRFRYLWSAIHQMRTATEMAKARTHEFHLNFYRWVAVIKQLGPHWPSFRHSSRKMDRKCSS